MFSYSKRHRSVRNRGGYQLVLIASFAYLRGDANDNRPVPCRPTDLQVLQFKRQSPGSAMTALWQQLRPTASGRLYALSISLESCPWHYPSDGPAAAYGERSPKAAPGQNRSLALFAISGH
jgi:hypothetical protein